MKKSDLFAMAWQNLRNRKTRTRLTIAGVVVGTCAIIIMVSIGLGIDKMITSQYKSQSSLNKISVYSEYDETSGKPTMPFDDSAVNYFKSISNVKTVIPTLEISSYATIARGKYTFSGSIYGIPIEQMKEIGYKLDQGDFSKVKEKNCMFIGKDTITYFSDAQGNSPNYKYDENYQITDSEIDFMKDVFTISAKSQNGDSDSVNYQSVTALNSSDDSESSNSQTGGTQKLVVSGVLKNSSNVDYDSAYSAYISLDRAKQTITESNKISSVKNYKLQYTNIYVYVNDTENIDTVKKEIQDKGYSCYTDDEELQSTKKVMLVVQLILGAIGGVSMFVAAFGISNTMVMSVFERTKEIGIMKVLGCEIKDIKDIFLYEAGIIGLFGGTIGVVISCIVSAVANIIAKIVMGNMYDSETLESMTVCVSSVPIWLILCGILFAVGVGVLAGLSPAKRSVKVSALTAIHNE